MSNYEGWSEQSLWAEYNKLKKQQGVCDNQKSRLTKAYNSLVAPKSVVKGYRKGCTSDEVVEKFGTWKGNLRTKKFDQSMEKIVDQIKYTYRSMDEYHDDIQDAIKKAGKKSGSYIPVLSDIYRAIKKVTN